jgi:hypothetical protein
LDATPTWVDILGFVIGVAGFAFGVFQYRQARLEERRQFAANAIERYRNDRNVTVAVQMLDWQQRQVWIPLDFEENGGCLEWVTHDNLMGALVPHEDKPKEKYTPLELRIRDVFDGFVDELEHLALQARAGAFAIKDVAPYMTYLAQLVRAEQNQVSTPVSKSVIGYIERYWGKHVVEFLNACCPPNHIRHPL